MQIYATTNDVIDLRGPQDADTLARLNGILPSCSAALRQYAKQANVHLDSLYESDEDIKALTTKAVVDASFNYLTSTKNNEPLMSQYTQSAGGYSVTGTLANVGGGYFFPKSVLRTLGILRPKAGILEVFGHDFLN